MYQTNFYIVLLIFIPCILAGGSHMFEKKSHHRVEKSAHGRPNNSGRGRSIAQGAPSPAAAPAPPPTVPASGPGSPPQPTPKPGSPAGPALPPSIPPPAPSTGVVAPPAPVQYGPDFSKYDNFGPPFNGQDTHYIVSKFKATKNEAARECDKQRAPDRKRYRLVQIKDDSEGNKLAGFMNGVSYDNVWTSGILQTDANTGRDALFWDTPSGDRVEDKTGQIVKVSKTPVKRQVATAVTPPAGVLETRFTFITVTSTNYPWLQTVSSSGKTCTVHPKCEPVVCQVSTPPCTTVTNPCMVLDEGNCTIIPSGGCSVKCENCTVTNPQCFVKQEPCIVEVEKICKVIKPNCSVITPECKTDRQPCVSIQPACTTKPPGNVNCTIPVCVAIPGQRNCTSYSPPCKLNFDGEQICPPPRTRCDPQRVCYMPQVCRQNMIYCPPAEMFCPPQKTVCPPPTVECSQPVVNCTEPEIYCPPPEVVCTQPTVNCTSPVVSCPATVSTCVNPQLNCPEPDVMCVPPTITCTKPPPCAHTDITIPSCDPPPCNQNCFCISLHKKSGNSFVKGNCVEKCNFVCQWDGLN